MVDGDDDGAELQMGEVAFDYGDEVPLAHEDDVNGVWHFDQFVGGDGQEAEEVVAEYGADSQTHGEEVGAGDDVDGGDDFDDDVVDD